MRSPGRHFPAGLLTQSQSSMERWASWIFKRQLFLSSSWSFNVDVHFVVVLKKLSDLRGILFNVQRGIIWNMWLSILSVGRGEPDRLPNGQHQWAGQLPQGFPRAHTLSLSPRFYSVSASFICSRKRKPTRRLSWDTVSLWWVEMSSTKVIISKCSHIFWLKWSSLFKVRSHWVLLKVLFLVHLFGNNDCILEIREREGKDGFWRIRSLCSGFKASCVHNKCFQNICISVF